MPDESNTLGGEPDGHQLIQKLQSIRRSLTDHADRHPRDVDARLARSEVERAIDIAIQAGRQPHCEEAAKLWLGYIMDDYTMIVHSSDAAFAHGLSS